jgi:hypothetical protein
MSNITKPVDRGIPSTLRTVQFTQADGGAGDVLMVQDSLGRNGKHVIIDADADISIRLNVYHTVYPTRESSDGLSQWAGFHNVALGQTYQNGNGAVYSVPGGESLVLDDDLPVRDIELVTVSGNFTITVS